MVSLATDTVDYFSFSEPFCGKQFYEMYKTAVFLKEEQMIRKILLQSNELEKRYNKLEPGTQLTIKGVLISTNVNLVLKKSKLLDESDMKQNDFTLRRFLGLVAAYVSHNYCHHNIYSAESERFGLTPEQKKTSNQGYATYCGGYNNSNSNGSNRISHTKIYYAAVSGAEYFFEEFGYLPFLFALRRHQLKQISDEMLLIIANTRDRLTDKALVMLCAEDHANATNIARQIGFNLSDAIHKSPEGIKCFIKCGY